jgi:amino acid permease
MGKRLRHAAVFASVIGAGLLTMPLLEPDWRERWLLLVVVLAILAVGVHFHRTENRPEK